jgi:hypothetical protein
MIQVKKPGKESLRPLYDVALIYPLRLTLFLAGDDKTCQYLQYSEAVTLA